jgi:hypothetical protein
MSTTYLADLINPEVMADSISAELPAKIAARDYMKVDTTLVARPGDTITIPRFNYIGPAADLAEGVDGSIDQLTTTQASYTVKKAVKNVELTDESILSGHGDPVGETTNQLRMAIQDKIDNDAIALLTSTGTFPRLTTASGMCYEAIEEAMDLYNQEVGGEVTLLVSPEGMSQLRKDLRLMGNELIQAEIKRTGVVGQVAGASVVVSNKLNATNDTRQAFLLKTDALTAFIKRDVNFESARNVLGKKTLFSVDEHFTVAIEDDNKIVGITHMNDVLGKLQASFSTKRQSDGTYDSEIHNVYPAKFDANTVYYKLGTAPEAVSFNTVISGSWTAVSGMNFTVTDIEATPVISIAQAKTTDGKAKYAGSFRLM